MRSPARIGAAVAGLIVGKPRQSSILSDQVEPGKTEPGWARRQSDDAVILRLVELLDQAKTRQFHGNQHSGLPTSVGKPRRQTSADETAAKIGTNRGKVEKARQVLTQADPETNCEI